MIILSFLKVTWNFYLHPNRFKSLGPHFLAEYNIEKPFVLIRYISWDSHHDLGETGTSVQTKISNVEKFREHCNVFISSEKPLPEELKKYKLNIPSEHIHSVISESSLLFGESATMSSEAALLRTPAIFQDFEGRGYTDELSSHDLVYCYSTDEKSNKEAMNKAQTILTDFEFSESNFQNFMKNKIDPTKFLVWFLINFPESHMIMKKSKLSKKIQINEQ